MTGAKEKGTIIKQAAFRYIFEKYSKKEGRLIHFYRKTKEGKVLFDFKLPLDRLIDLLIAYFNVISKLFPHYWGVKKGSLLSQSVGVNGLILYFAHIINTIKRPTGKIERMEGIFLKYLRPIKGFYFSSKRDIASGYKGFDRLVELLRKYKREHS